MTSVCLIGNSHVGALKLGWPQIEAEFPGVTLDFYASAGESLDLDVIGGHLEPADEKIRTRLAYTSGKNGNIEPGYDTYIVCGLLLSLARAMQAYRSKIMELRKEGGKAAGAKDALLEAVRATLRPLLFADVMAKLRQITPAPIFLIGTPLPAYERFPRMQGFGVAGKAAIRSTYEKATAAIAQEFDAQFLPQPPQTVGPIELTTKPEFYLLDAERVRQEKSAHTHMNADYGAVVLKDALEHICGLKKA